jgi:ribose transport system substrate-binding protein
VAACSGGEAKSTRPRLAFVTNGVDDFWTIASKGVAASARDCDAECDVLMPHEGAADQKRKIEDLLTRGVDGIAISPIDAANQIEMIDEACARTNVITQDSDAPGTKRLCYIGMDNYVAGRMCGALVKEVMPAGGSVMAFVGRLEQDNARKRRQGLIDELLDRAPDPARYDPPGQPLSGAKYQILDTRTDQFDHARAKSNAEDAIARYPDLGCMVGLFAYNTPACMEAVQEAGKLGTIHLVAFDENSATLQGILDGKVHGTIVQNPYQYGYESVRVLAALARGDKSVLPGGGFLDVPARAIRRDGAQAFWDELKHLTEK